MTYVVAYLGTALCFLLLDFLWLGVVAKDFYRRQIGSLLLDNFNVAAAIGFYLVFIAGVVVFAISPALTGGSSRTAVVLGALFGFFTYATYDITNLATLKGWTATVAAVDIAWGTVLAGLSSAAGYAAARAYEG